MPLQIDPQLLELQGALAGQYSIERELGRGGMGIVYLAREVALDRLVALKLLPPERAERPGVRERFLREARTAARLSHPHIVPIYRVETSSSWTWFAMAFIDGETLAERVRRLGPLPAHEATRLLREVAWALAYANAAGIVHRDVKPENILIERVGSRALVTDFGIAHLTFERLHGTSSDDRFARSADGLAASEPADAPPLAQKLEHASSEAAPLDHDGVPASLTAQGHVLGTAHYMSPEQAVGDAIDGRSDLYALGAVAHFALAGRVPFDAPTNDAVMLKQLREEAPRLAARAPNAPAALAQAVDRCLAKRPDDRWSSLEAFAEALAGAPTTSLAVPAPVRLWMADQPWLATVDLALIMGGFLTSLNFGSMFPLIGGVLGAVGVHATARLVRTRHLLADGFSLAEIRRGLRQRLDERNEEVAYSIRRPLSFFVTAVSARVPLSDPAPRWRLGDLNLRHREWLWHGPGGEWMNRLASWRLARSLDANALRDRPTELALGIAAEELYRALSAETRKALGDLPGMLRELEAEASAVRGEMLAAQGSARETKQQRLQSVVAALEALRLDLLRLTVGVGTIQSVTTAMHAALELGEAATRAAAGHDGARRSTASLDDQLLVTPV